MIGGELDQLIIPKVIWMYWSQGKESLPFLVRTCIESWRLNNPGWEIRFLDHGEVAGLVDLEGFDRRQDISLQMLSDIIRVKLLRQFGGIWVDATLFCSRPLDEWLPPLLQEGFFAFSSRRRDRLITNWFIASLPGSELLSRWAEEVIGYWHSNHFRQQGYWSRQLLHKLMSLRKRGVVSNHIWFSEWMRNWLKIHPYPVNMYLFESMLERFPALQQQWSVREMIYDQPAEQLQNVLGMNAAVTEESCAFLNGNHTPVHKLNWRQDMGTALPGSNFEFLISGLKCRVPETDRKMQLQ